AIHGVDFVLSPDLRPIALHGSASLIGLFRQEIGASRINDTLHTSYVSYVPEPAPLPPPSPVKPAVVPSLAFCIPPNPLLAALRLHAELNLHQLQTWRKHGGSTRA